MKRKPEDVVKAAVEKAEEVHGLVEKALVGVEQKHLSSSDTFCFIQAPDVVANRLYGVHYMGRQVTGEIIHYILKPVTYPGRMVPLVTNPALLIRFITGTPGAGKGVSLLAAAATLHLSFTGNKDEKRRLAYLNVADFIHDPGESLWRALIMAFVKDVGDQFRLALESVYICHEDEIIHLLTRSHRADSIYLLFGDGNKLESDDIPEGARSRARRAIIKLAGICKVVVCASIRSKLRRDLMKDVRPEHFLFCGGYSKEELKAYARHSKNLEYDEMYRSPTVAEGKKSNQEEAEDEGDESDEEDEDYESEEFLDTCRVITGGVPRLVHAYFYPEESEEYVTVSERKKSVDHALYWYKAEAKAYLEKVSLVRDSELVKALRGEEVRKLTEAMDSRVLFCSFGRGKCLTEELQAYMLMAVNLKFQAANENYALEAVRDWVSSVLRDGNASRMGWNAEEATILAFKLLQPVIEFGQQKIHIKPDRCRSFKGRFSRKLLKEAGNVRTLHLSEKFNHIGADFVYSDGERVIVFQASIADKAREHHQHTLEVAAEVFQDEPRKCLVIWI